MMFAFAESPGYNLLISVLHASTGTLPSEHWSNAKTQTTPFLRINIPFWHGYYIILISNERWSVWTLRIDCPTIHHINTMLSPDLHRSFDTQEGSWQDIELPFQKFIPIFRAKSKPDAGPLNPASITSIQVRQWIVYCITEQLPAWFAKPTCVQQLQYRKVLAIAEFSFCSLCRARPTSWFILL